MKALLVDAAGERPVMVPGEHPDPVAGDRELLVAVKATAVNRADLAQKAGKYPPPEGASPLLGLEMAGVVEQTGRGVTRYGPGDRVFGLLPGGGYASYCVIHEEMAMPVPEMFSFEQAAAVPEAFLTAWQALALLGEAREGERVLVHAGASGVGTAAIQLAKRRQKCMVAVTVGSVEKADLCWKLGADLAVNYKQEDFRDVIAGTWGPAGIDLIIDPVGAPYWERNIDLLGMDGRLVYLAFMGGSRVDEVRLGRPLSYKIALTQDFQAMNMDLLADGRLQPVIDSVFNWTEAEKAHQRMEQNLNAGKLVLTGF
jgi:tumor protein p53-inducible protein 3